MANKIAKILKFGEYISSQNSETNLVGVICRLGVHNRNGRSACVRFLNCLVIIIDTSHVPSGKRGSRISRGLISQRVLWLLTGFKDP